MTFTVGFGWWLLPLAITIAAFAWDWWVHKDEVQADGYSVIGQSMGHAITFLMALVISLMAWLAYFMVA
jgi:hypothetical protein